MAIRALIVDDEPLARRGLALRLERFPGVDVVGMAADGREAVNLVESLQPNVVFLDVQMPAYNGFHVVTALAEANKPFIVFVTAYSEYATRAFDAEAVDYLLKPVDAGRLEECVERLHKRLAKGLSSQEREQLIRAVADLSGEAPASIEEAVRQGDLGPGRRFPSRLPVKGRGKTLRLPVERILWVEAAGDYLCIHTEDGTHVMRGTMKRLEDSLDPNRFQRIHRSTIINVDRVVEFRPHINGEYFLRLESGKELKLSRQYKHKIALFNA